MVGTSDSAAIFSIWRYPVKGLSGERLTTVELAPGATLRMDRAFALENGSSGFDPAAPSWQPKIKFLCLMRNTTIAALVTRYDDASDTLTISRDSRTVLEARLSDPTGRAEVEHFFQGYMANEARGKIRLLQAPAALPNEGSGQRTKGPRHSFSDVAKKVVSIINLESVDTLSKAIGRPVHPLRFRGNLYVRGWPAWTEAQLVGEEIAIGGARLRVLKTIQRCAATEVDPETAERNINVPESLYRLTGEHDCGVYAEVLSGGTIAESDTLSVG